ncbi:hypothetical protein [Micromonospora sp. NBS 11-29]|uniref:hypothetical protein n=1 Tax=Micromonospora sp. NBS 11-29 TaxID=1960879 RepID=UPI000B7733F0|nr:hypothetical protein [Micromonospora sp. NBS 11-29]
MGTFNPFAFFHYASHAELDSAVAYLRDCVDDPEGQRRSVPTPGAETSEAGPCGRPIARLRRRIGRG